MGSTAGAGAGEFVEIIATDQETVLPGIRCHRVTDRVVSGCGAAAISAAEEVGPNRMKGSPESHVS